MIFATSWTLATLGFDNRGALTFAPRILKREATTYGEYGITDWLTGIAQVSVANRFIAGIVFDRYSGIDAGALGLRTRLARAGPFSFAVETTLRALGASDRFRLAQAGRTGFEGDISVQAGANFKLWSWSGYGAVGLGYRARTAGPADEYRADFSLGIRPRKRWLWLLQSFNSFPAGRGGTGFRPMREHKLVTSVVYDIDTRWSVQSGTIATIAGKNVPRDTGAFMALWYRF